MGAPGDLYGGSASAITFGLVKRFVEDAELADLLTESMTFELKRQRTGRNVAEAIAGLANSDGGLVLLGVDDAKSPIEGRFPGVPRAEFDALVDHLSGLLEHLPELIPVAIPGTDRLVIVARVDADAFRHPVLVSGRVMFRVPGATVPADWRRVVDLVERERRPISGLAMGPLLMDPQRQNLWSDADVGWHFKVRVLGGIRLPERIVQRPWLTSAGRDAVVDSLQDSPMFSPSVDENPSDRRIPQWHPSDRRSTWLMLSTSSETIGGSDGLDISHGAYVALEGRNLVCNLGTRFRGRGGRLMQLSLAEVHQTLVHHVRAVDTLTQLVATALEAPAPVTALPWRGWLQAGEGFDVLHVLDLARFERDSQNRAPEAVLPTLRVDSPGSEGVGQLVHDWLTVCLLDLGVRDFEQELNGLLP